MNWSKFIYEESQKDYFKELIKFIEEESEKYTIYPPHKHLFRAYKRCRIENIKCVILAQDPYINEGEAHGLAFSVPATKRIPPSLRNIFKEIKDDVGAEPPKFGSLMNWSEDQGIFLLNCILTVRAGESGSHRGKGWETFTDNTIKLINDLDRPIVFLLWGAFARSKKPLITNERHLVLEAAHPSPYSANNGFFGCKHFSKANEFLVKNGIEPINWSIDG